jgi:hypothetical protein
MKKKLTVLLAAIILLPLLLSSFYNPADTDQYIIIGWNDLGMHCANKNFNSVVILPPYNNLRSQVIKKGSPTQNPEIVTSGVTVSYEVPGNTYSVGKTNFWDYAYDLFGVTLPDDIGLTGAGLTGTMAYSAGHYSVDGVPLTPYTDADTENEDPFQLALFTLTDLNGNQLATTQNVIPVSGEIGCVSSGCHSSEQNILNEHEDEGGFDPTNLPILCAECHADFALGTTGHPGLPSLSEVIHDKHKDKTNDCYKCHPGQDAQCFRGAMHAAGMVCQDCHGSMSQVAQSIKNGRRPWQDEPSCGTTACHGATYAPEPGKLFKDSKGHGGLYCSACHGSPHADLPSTNDRDNVQNIALQGYAGTLNSCTVCHGYNPTGAGPHGLYYEGGNAATLPFTETWENNSGTRNTNGEIYTAVGYSWAFETDLPNKGKVNWGTNAFLNHDGNGALTLDKDFPTSSYAMNAAILTIDLSNYVSSTELELSFWWADHGDEEHPNDKVWIRGSNSGTWVQAYDLNPAQTPNNTYQYVGQIDIDNLLASASPAQSVSSTFQVRFGQQDNGPTPSDGISFDDISIIENSIVPSVLPFLETWENNSSTRNTNGEIYSADGYNWTFETNNPGKGRAKWGTNALIAHNGNGALTMDKDFPTSSYAINYSILTIDLSSYTSSNGLELSFWWADHGDEEHSNDKVWIRGSNTGAWVQAYDLNPAQNPNNVYKFVGPIDIDNALSSASPAQIVSSTFQVRFGQEDNGPTPSDGISFDDISIVESTPPPAQTVLAIDNNVDVKKPDVKIYSNSGNVVIQSDGIGESDKMDVIIYDMMGRKVIESSYPQNSVVQIPVYQNNCYLVVKVISSSEVYTSKVFMR